MHPTHIPIFKAKKYSNILFNGSCAVHVGTVTSSHVASRHLELSPHKLTQDPPTHKKFTRSKKKTLSTEYELRIDLISLSHLQIYTLRFNFHDRARLFFYTLQGSRTVTVANHAVLNIIEYERISYLTLGK